MVEFSNIQLEFKNTFNDGYLTGRPADTIQVSAGLFVPLYAQPTRLGYYSHTKALIPC